MPMMKNVKFPANAISFTDFLMEIAHLDLFPTEWFEELIYYLPEQVAFNINFEACGIESKLIIKNIGSTFVIIMIYALVATMTTVFYKNERIWNFFGPIIFWNGLIRLFMELYQDLALMSFLNLKSAEWDSVYPSVRYSNYLSALFLAIILAVPVLLGYVLYKNVTKWNDEKFQDKFGSLFEGTDLKKNSKSTTVAVLLIFLLRRLSIVISVVALEEYVWG